MSEAEVDSVYVPYSPDPQVSAWAVDAGLQMFTNVSEENAALLAEGNPGHLYFFAELTVEDLSIPRLVNDEIIHRDAVSGKFVSEDYVEEHPDTTVTETD